MCTCEAGVLGNAKVGFCVVYAEPKSGTLVYSFMLLTTRGHDIRWGWDMQTKWTFWGSIGMHHRVCAANCCLTVAGNENEMMW